MKDPYSAKVTWPDGTAVSVFSGESGAIAHETVTCNGSDEIDMIVKVAPSRAGHLEGLLGDPGEPFDELVGGNGAVYSLDQLAAPWESVAGLRRAVPPVRAELAHHPAELALLLPDGHQHCQLHRPRLPEQGAHRCVADANDRRCRRSATARPKALPTPTCSPTASTTWASPVVATSAWLGPRPVSRRRPAALRRAAYPRAAAPFSRAQRRPAVERHSHRPRGTSTGTPVTRRERPERTAGRRRRRVGHGLCRVAAKLDQAELLQAG